MNVLDKWADRIYSDTDVGRSIATSITGVIGLICYFSTSDWVVSGFCFLIIFPIVRLLVSSRQERIKEASRRHQEQERANACYCSLSSEEKAVVDGFVTIGGCAMTWENFNRSKLSSAAIETLIERNLARTSLTADGLTETFVLDISLFDAGVRAQKSSASG